MARYDNRPNPYAKRSGFAIAFSSPRVLFAIGFLAVFAVVCAVGRLPWSLLGIYVTASMITFGAYAYDKFSAKAGRWRTPEKTLLTLGLFGGWPGGMLAQQWIRHKTVKTSFQVSFWATVMINCGFLIWLATQATQDLNALWRLIRFA